MPAAPDDVNAHLDISLLIKAGGPARKVVKIEQRVIMDCHAGSTRILRTISSNVKLDGSVWWVM